MLANTGESPRASRIRFILQPTLTVEPSGVLFVDNVAVKFSESVQHILRMFFLWCRYPAVAIIILVVTAKNNRRTCTVNIKAGIANTSDSRNVCLGVATAKDRAFQVLPESCLEFQCDLTH